MHFKNPKLMMNKLIKENKQIQFEINGNWKKKNNHWEKMKKKIVCILNKKKRNEQKNLEK